MIYRVKYVISSACVLLTFSSFVACAQKKENPSNKKGIVSNERSVRNPFEIRSISDNPEYINVETPIGKRSFRYSPDDTSTPDNGSTVVVTKSGRRYKQVLDGPVNAQIHFSAKGNGVADDTRALQAAIDAACNANNPAQNGTSSPSNGSNTVFIPHGIYKVSDEILIKGSCSIVMEQATSYGGTRIRQVTPGKHLFRIVKDTDGRSSGVHIIGGILQSGASKASPNISLIFGGEGKNDANNNSTYIENVWFQTPEQYGICMFRGDDINIRNCTFDVSAYHAIRFGSPTSTVTNASITGCTFYDIRAGAIDLVHVSGLIISNNRIYTNDGKRIPYFVNANGTSIKGLQIVTNQLSHVNKLAFVSHTAEEVQITSNMHRFGQGRSIELGGGQTISAILIANNMFSGDFSGIVSIGGGVPDAPIFGYSTGLTNSRITGNIIRHIGKSTASTPMLLTDKRVLRNMISDNTLVGFSDKGQIANALQNQ